MPSDSPFRHFSLKVRRSIVTSRRRFVAARSGEAGDSVLSEVRGSAFERRSARSSVAMAPLPSASAAVVRFDLRHTARSPAGLAISFSSSATLRFSSSISTFRLSISSFRL